jgi:hypothetical protein
MPFSQSTRLEALIACQRYCCLCHHRKHTRIQCHHIVPEAAGGPDTYDNCIPLCPDCHAEVKAFNPQHPVGSTPYHREELIRRRDDWYGVISRRSNDLADRLHRAPGKYPHSAALFGRIAFNYSNHDGFCRLGEGNCEFLTHWTKASDTTIHCFTDGTNVDLALAPRGSGLRELSDASLLDFSSRNRTPQIGQFLVFENHAARYAAAKVVAIQDDTRASVEDSLVFDYWILEDGSDDFSAIA